MFTDFPLWSLRTSLLPQLLSSIFSGKLQFSVKPVLSIYTIVIIYCWLSNVWWLSAFIWMFVFLELIISFSFICLIFCVCTACSKCISRCVEFLAVVVSTSQTYQIFHQFHFSCPRDLPPQHSVFLLSSGQLLCSLATMLGLYLAILVCRLFLREFAHVNVTRMRRH